MGGESAHGHIPGLDGVRAIAIGMVLVLHGTYGQFPGGWLGVDLFFVLSGYLITGLLARELEATGRARLGRFYLRRALRLLPALACAVLLAGVLWPAPPPSWPRSAACVLAYAANLVPAAWLGPLGHCWSLSVEEHFYLAWPPAFALAWRLGGRKCALVLASAGAAAVVASRPLLAPRLAGMGLVAGHFTLARADSLLVGSAAALLVPPGSARRPRATSCVLAAGLALALLGGLRLDEGAVRDGRWGYLGVAAVAASLVVASAQASPAARLLSAAPLAWVGRRSYGIYLYHFPIFLALESARERHSPANFAAVTAARLALTMAVAAASYRYAEAPFLAMKRRYTSDAPASSGWDLPNP